MMDCCIAVKVEPGSALVIGWVPCGISFFQVNDTPAFHHTGGQRCFSTYKAARLWKEHLLKHTTTIRTKANWLIMISVIFNQSSNLCVASLTFVSDSSHLYCIVHVHISFSLFSIIFITLFTWMFFVKSCIFILKATSQNVSLWQ